MTRILHTQQERTDLPLTVMPCVVDDMIEPFMQHFDMLRDVTRLRMYTDTTLDPQEIIRRCEGADAVIVIGVHITDELYEALTSHVKLFVFGGTGVASYIDLPRAERDGVGVCNVRHYGDAAVAEFAVALMMELSRHVGELNTQVRNGDWHGLFGTELNNKTLGILGFGGIGQTVARIAHGFGMDVRVWNSHVHADSLDGIELVDSMADLVAGSDIVSVHLPLTDETRGIITDDVLSKLRSGTMFINTARAEVIAHGALERRLMRGDILAGLDVFEEEPLPADSPLRTMPGVIRTPHVAWRADGAYASMTEQIMRALVSFFEGGDYNRVV